MTKEIEWHGTADARRIGSTRRSEAMRSALPLLKAKLRSLISAVLDGRSAPLTDRGGGPAVLAK
jgi:hypothetical protein